jgi:hypothetical protein
MDGVLAASPTSVRTSVVHSIQSNSTPDQSLIHITAGKIQDFNFSIRGPSYGQANTQSLQGFNSQDQQLPRISDLAVSLVSQSSSVRILGDTQWNMQSLRPGSNIVLSTKVYASPTLIGSPVFFTVTAQYIQNGQQIKTDSFDIGAVVVGDIKLEINNVGIRYLGSTPNLVGNLLNEGNTPALFTNIQMVQSEGLANNNTTNSQSVPKGITILPLSSDYLGSIPANSPVPFSIPLRIIKQQERVSTQQNNINTLITDNEVQGESQNTIEKSTANHNEPQLTNVQSGNQPLLYPVALNITYNDDLKNPHQLTINRTVGQNFELGSISDTQNKFDINSPNQIQNIHGTGGSIFTNGFVDSYWAANSSVCSANGNSSTLSVCSSTSSALPIPPQQEVGPGEGQSIFAVVLSNTEFSDINGIIGYLTLPPGFTSATSIGGSVGNNDHSPKIQQTGISNLQPQDLQQQQTAIASFTNVVKSGQTYTLYFKVNIGKGVKVGDYSASLRIYYFKVPSLEPGVYNTQTYMVPISLPGKVILDTSSKTTSLKPGFSNTAVIDIKNKGTADANSVLVTITSISGNSIANNVVVNQPGTTSNTNNTSTTTATSTPGQVTTTSPTSTVPAVNLGSRTFNLGTIPVNGTAEIDPVIYPSESAGGTLQNLNLQISYTASTGDSKSTSASVGLLVLPTPPEAGLSVGPSGPPTNSTGSINSNQGGDSNGITASGVTASAYSFNDHNQSSPDLLHSTLDSSTTEHLRPEFATYIDNDGNSPYSQDQHMHNIAYGATVNNPHSNVKSSDNPNNNLNSSSLILTAGKVQDMKFTITNNNDFPITNAVASIASESDDLKIVGDSLWSLPSLAPHSKNEFTTKIYASTSLIAAPVSFLVTLQYISGGQSKIGSFVLGGNVVGDIHVSVTDLAINYVAGTPNLVGNLLNQGNTIGLYTTAQLVNQPFATSSARQQDNSRAHHEGQSSDQHRNNASQSSGLVPSVASFLLPPPQYLGDLQPDSPLPFSIPLTNVDNSTLQGSHPVSLKITYSDDLKNSHEVTINQTLQVKPQISHTRGDRHSQNTILGIPMPILLLVIVAIVAFIIIRLIRKRRKAKADAIVASESGQTVEDEDDIEKLLDSSESPETEHQNIDRKSNISKK